MFQVAICYYGLTRSTKYVYKTHHKYLFDELKKHNIEYDTFIHTWRTEKHNIVWNDKVEIPIDYEEYKLLCPSEYQIDDEDIFIEQNIDSHFSDYFNEELFNKYGGLGTQEWYPQMIKNYICGLESQRRVSQMVLNKNKTYDFIIYMRPDIEIKNPFPVDIFSKMTPYDISIPNHGNFDGCNAIIAVISFQTMEDFSNKINELVEYRKYQGRIVAEKFVEYIYHKYYDKIYFIDLGYTVIRPDGK